MVMLQVILLCAAVSFDGFGAGFSYGARNLRIPLPSLVIISFSSAAAMTLSMLLGWTLTSYVSVSLSSLFGGVILVSLGSWVIWQGANAGGEEENNALEIERDEQPFSKGEKRLHSGKGLLSFIKKVLVEPEEADLDRSGSINCKEAFLLGLALAGDAFAAGIGVALAGFDPWLTSIMVGLSKFMLLKLGLFGGRFSRNKLNAFPVHLLSGGMLILVGIFNIL